MARVQLPPEISQLICCFSERKYQAYVVGDAVKQLYLGFKPQDYDIVVNAEPERIRVVLEGYRIADDSDENGVLVLIKGLTVMISGCSSDESGRLNKTVAARERHFTINALFADENGEITDPFDAIGCLEAEPYTLDFVGEPTGEMIMEGLALEAEGDHTLSPRAVQLIAQGADLPAELPREQLREYVERIIMGKRAGDVLLLHKETVFAIFPELAPTDEYDTRSKYHVHTLYRHTCKAVEFAVPNLSVRYALLFHGSGKPDCEGINGNFISFHGHAERAEIYARRAFSRLGTDKEVADDAAFLIRNHDFINADKDFNPSDYSDEFSNYELKLLMQFSAANIRSKDPRHEVFARNLRRHSDLL